MVPRWTSASTGGATLRGIARSAGGGLAGGARGRDAGWSGHRAMVPRHRGRVGCSMRSVTGHPDFPTLHVSSHPAVQHKLALLRDETTEPKKFRELVREISWLVGYEALADARVAPIQVQTPLERDRGRPAGRPHRAACPSCGPAWAWSTRCWS